MAAGVIPPAEELRARFSYDPETGVILDGNGTRKFATKCTGGYLRGSVNGSVCYAHRVIWKLVHGKEPAEIDHINGDTSDNRLENLRAAEKSSNARNRKISSNNTSGIVGVGYHPVRAKWLGHIAAQGRRWRKVFDTRDAAVRWRRMMEARLGFHPNHGRPVNLGERA